MTRKNCETKSARKDHRHTQKGPSTAYKGPDTAPQRQCSRGECHSSLPRLAAPRKAAALLVLIAASFAFIAPAAAQTVNIWSATLNVKELGASSFGCTNTSPSGKRCSQSSVLSDDDFNLDGRNRTIPLIIERNGTFQFHLAHAPRTSIDHMTLHVGDTALPFASATHDFDVFSWRSTDISWSDGEQVQLRITAPASRTPINPSLRRSTNLGTDGVARSSVTMSWRAPSQGNYSGVQFRLGRYPESRNGAAPGTSACAGNRAFSNSESAWYNIPNSGPGGRRSFTFDARWLGCGGLTINTFELRAQMRAVQREWPNPWSASEPSDETLMPNTVPRLLGVGLGSGDVSALESGDSLVIRAVFDRPVRVRTNANEPSIGLTINGTTRRAVFHRVVSPPRFRNYGSNVGSAIEFAYTMQASDAEASEITVTRNSLRATGGASIVSATGGSNPSLNNSQVVLRDDRWNAEATSDDPLTATFESVPSSLTTARRHSRYRCSSAKPSPPDTRRSATMHSRSRTGK